MIGNRARQSLAGEGLDFAYIPVCRAVQRGLDVVNL